MGNAQIIKLILLAGWEIWRAYKQAKKDDQIEEIEKNPSDWMRDHFGGVRDNSADDQASKANGSNQSDK